MQISMFSSEEPLARAFQSPVSVRDWMTLVATSPSRLLDWWTATGLDGSCGKTSPEFCHRTEGETSVPSSTAWQRSGISGPGGCLTLNGSEWPSAVAVCSLSSVLETGDLPQRFYLSPKACAGILRRAEKRGKELPVALHTALEAVATQAARTGQEGGRR